jgi:hypothetical protein
MQTRLTTIAQQFPAVVASMSLLGVIFFYMAASCVFA